MKFVIPSLLVIFLFNTVVSAQFSVGLTDGTIRSGINVELERLSMGEVYIRLQGDEQIPMTQVKYFHVKEGYFKVINENGIHYFKRESVGSRITIYSNSDYLVMDASYLRRNKRFYYEMDGGTLKKVKFKNVQKDVGDDSAANQFLRKRNKLQVISAIGVVGGLMLMVAGGEVIVVGAFQPSTPNNAGLVGAGLIIIGTTALFTPAFLASGKRKQLLLALSAFDPTLTPRLMK